MKPGVTLSYCLFIRNYFRTTTIKLWGISALLMAMAPAYADQFDTVNYIGSVGVNYDDNIFRLPSGYDAQTYLGKATKSDLVKVASLGINVDKKYSNQEIVFNAVGSINQYSNFTNLDNTSSSFTGAWIWQVTPRFSGSLNATRTQSLNSPSDTRIFARDLNTTDNAGLNGDWWLHSNWHLLFGVSDGETTNSISATNFQNSNNSSREWGVKYDPSNGKSISLIARNLQGNNSNQVPDPVNFLETGFNEKQLDLLFSWDINGKSKLSGDLMNVDHQNFHYSQRNYSGNQGGINYSLGISGKTSLNMSLQRSFNSWWDPFNSYFITDSISISPSWQMSSKATLHMTISQGANDYYGPVVPEAIARHDTTQSVQMGIDWTPQRALTISASLQHNQRTSTPAYYSGYGFVENSVLVTVQAFF